MAVVSVTEAGERRRSSYQNGVTTHTRVFKVKCDDPRDGCYNRPVGAPFAPSHEALARADNLYDICLVMDWNMSSRRRNGGSAIFFHLARPGYLPTEGCIAVRLADMSRLLRAIGPGTVVRVV